MSKAPALTSGGTTQNDPQTYLGTILVKASATCGQLYNELAGEYTFSGTGYTWTKLIDNLPKYNEYGHEYRYYVVETSPSSGYDVAYSDQTNGLANNGVATITNTKHFGSLLITKNVLYNGNPAATAAEKALVNGTYTFAVKKDGTEISGSPFSITVSDGVTNKLLIQNLEPGDYTIEETAPTGFTVTPSGGTSVSGNVVTVTVTADKEAEAQLLDAAKAAFTNNCTAYQDFTFTKVWRDAVGRSNMSWPAGQSITVKILQNDTLYATYTIGASDLVVGTQIAATGDSTKPKLTVTAADPSTGYTFKLVGLPSGSVYYVMENETVTGYQPPKYFNAAGTKVEGNQIDDNGSIKNDLVGYELPKTGGTGTGGIRTAGAGLVLMALAGLTAAGLKRRRRRST